MPYYAMERLDELDEKMSGAVARALGAGLVFRVLAAIMWPLLSVLALGKFTFQEVVAEPKSWLIIPAVLLTLGTLLWCIRELVLFWRFEGQRRSWLFGLRGEQAVAEKLASNDVAAAGHTVFHDLAAEKRAPGDAARGPRHIHPALGRETVAIPTRLEIDFGIDDGPEEFETRFSSFDPERECDVALLDQSGWSLPFETNLALDPVEFMRHRDALDDAIHRADLDREIFDFEGALGNKTREHGAAFDAGTSHFRNYPPRSAPGPGTPMPAGPFSLRHSFVDILAQVEWRIAIHQLRARLPIDNRLHTAGFFIERDAVPGILDAL